MSGQVSLAARFLQTADPGTSQLMPKVALPICWLLMLMVTS